MNTKFETYIVGVDGGGTKTTVELHDLKDGSIKRSTFGILNFNGSEAFSVSRTIQQIIDFLRTTDGGLDGCRSICVGTAGISNPQQRQLITSSLKHAGLNAPLELVGDTDIALAGAFNNEPGILLISGTGSVCCGLNAAGKRERAGGWGHIVSDKGSGYAIGRKILTAVTEANDGLIAPTVFSKLVEEELHFSGMRELISWTYDPSISKKDIAALSPLLEKGLAAGDDAAKKILDSTALSLARLVCCVAQKLQLQDGSLALGGSVLNNSELVVQALKAVLKEQLPDLKVQQPLFDGASGAIILAKKAMEKGSN